MHFSKSSQSNDLEEEYALHIQYEATKSLLRKAEEAHQRDIDEKLAGLKKCEREQSNALLQTKESMKMLILLRDQSKQLTFLHKSVKSIFGDKSPNMKQDCFEELKDNLIGTLHHPFKSVVPPQCETDLEECQDSSLQLFKYLHPLSSAVSSEETSIITPLSDNLEMIEKMRRDDQASSREM